MKTVVVEWIDSCLQNGQVDKTEFPKPVMIFSYGVLVEETDDYVTVARDNVGEGDFRGLLSIPRVAVHRVVELFRNPPASRSAALPLPHALEPYADPEDGTPYWRCRRCGLMSRMSSPSAPCVPIP